MFQSQLKVTNRFISTTAWCKRLGRPARRCSAVSGCFSPGMRWSRSCRGSPKIRGPDPEHQKWILSSLLYAHSSNLTYRTPFQYLPTLNLYKNIAHLERVPAGGKLLPVVDLEDPLLPVQPLRRRQGSAKKYLEDISNINKSIQHVKIATNFHCKKHFQGILPTSCKKHIPCTVGSSPQFGLSG